MIRSGLWSGRRARRFGFGDEAGAGRPAEPRRIAREGIRTCVRMRMAGHRLPRRRPVPVPSSRSRSATTSYLRPDLSDRRRRRRLRRVRIFLDRSMKCGCLTSNVLRRRETVSRLVDCGFGIRSAVSPPRKAARTRLRGQCDLNSGSWIELNRLDGAADDGLRTAMSDFGFDRRLVWSSGSELSRRRSRRPIFGADRSGS